MYIQNLYGSFTISDINSKELSLLYVSLDFYLSHLSNDLERLKSGDTSLIGDNLSSLISNIEENIEIIKNINKLL